LKRKIIAISALVPPDHSGAGKRVVAQLEELSELGWACELWTCTQAENNELYDIYKFSIPRKKSIVRYVFFVIKVFFVALGRLFLSNNVVVYAVSARCKIGLTTSIACAILNVPFVVGSTLDKYDDVSTLIRRPYGRLFKMILRKSYAWIAISPKLYKGFDTIKGFNPKYIPNHVDLERFSPLQKSERDVIREKMGFDDNSILLIGVGGIMPRKGIVDIIKTFAISIPDQWNGQLLLVGSYDKDEEYCKYYEECVELIHEYGVVDRVFFLGLRNDVSDLLRMSDIYIQMSHSEGFPNSLIEAMATGLPVIVRRINGITDFISQTERSDCDCLCEGVDDAVVILKKNISGQEIMRWECGVKNRAIVKADFDRKNIISEYDQLFVSALNIKD